MRHRRDNLTKSAGSIFQRQRSLTPSQLVTVATRRFEDARALCDTGKNAHANGAQYLCGFVVELLLKAHLVRQYAATANRPAHDVREAERMIWSLIYRSHDLEEMLSRLPQVQAMVIKREEREGRPYWSHLRGLCSEWTIYARYSTQTSQLSAAREMLRRVRELKEILK